MMPCLSLAKRIMKTSFGFSSPFELNFAITYKCNSRCTTCNIWKKKLKKELTKKEIEKFAKKADFPWVRLTGGEPFLRNDYADIVKVLNKHMNICLLSTPTNGMLPDIVCKQVEEVLSFFKGRYVITVSLDGPRNVHNKIRNVKGSWQRAVETYKKLKTLENHKNFKVFFGYTISPQNADLFFDTLSEMRNLLPVTANDFHINLFQVSDTYYNNASANIPADYKENALREVGRILKIRKGSGLINSVEKKYLELAKKYLETGRMPVKCNIFNLSCFIDPYGNVYPCSMFNKKLGSLRQARYDIKKMLGSEDAKKTREDIKKGLCPQCWTPCEAHQMILSKWWKI